MAATVTVERRLKAPPEAIFDAWLDPDGARHWLFATAGGVMERCEIDARVGGRFRIAERRGSENGAAQSPGLRDGGPILAEHHGEYIEIDRPRRLAFDFRTSFDEERTRVMVTIAPDGDGSRVTLIHENVPEEWQKQTSQGWTMILDGLARALTV